LPNSSVSTAIRVNVTAALTLAARTWNYWLYSTIGGHFGASPVSKPVVSYGHGERSDWILEIWHALNGWYGEFVLRCRRTCVSGSCVDATICAAGATVRFVREMRSLSIQTWRDIAQVEAA